MDNDEYTSLVPRNSNQTKTYTTIEQSENNTVNISVSTRQRLLSTVAIVLQISALWIAFGIIAPFFPLEAAKKGSTQTEIGLIFGVYQLVMFLMTPVYGSYIHKIGAKFMFLSGSFLLGGCSIAFGVLDRCPGGAIFVVMCLLVRAIAANASAMVVTACFALAAKLYPNNVGQALGTLETFTGVALILGPSIGGGLYSAGGYILPFVVIGGVVWLMAVLCYFVMPSIEDVTRVEGSMLQLLKVPGCVVIYISAMVCILGIAFLDPTFSPFMKTQFPYLTIAQIGLIFMITPAVYAITAPLAGWISDKGWIMACPIFGLITGGCSLFLLGPSPIFNGVIPTTLAGILSFLAIMGIGGGFSLISLFPHALCLAKNAGFEDNLQTMGLISGWINSATCLGGFIGPIIGGYLTEQRGFPFATSVCGAITLIMALVFSLYGLLMYCGGKWPISVSEPARERQSQTSRPGCSKNEGEDNNCC